MVCKVHGLQTSHATPVVIPHVAKISEKEKSQGQGINSVRVNKCRNALRGTHSGLKTSAK